MGTFIKTLFKEWNKYQEAQQKPTPTPAPSKPESVPVTEPKPVPTPEPVPPKPEPPAPTPILTPHEQATINLLERPIFMGRQLNASAWSDIESFCKAGPTQLIVADTNLIPSQMTQAGFKGRENAQWFALSRTYAGFNWLPGNDGELQALSNERNELGDWWDSYIIKVVEIMVKAPQTTATIIANDALDHCGRQLGNSTYKTMQNVSDRVLVGDTVPD